ncbi:MAG: hypothetical protein AAB289_05720 [Chloroflexota bacterium]
MFSSHTFLCAACGDQAVVVSFAAAGEPLRHPGGILDQTLSRIQISDGPIPMTKAPVSQEAGVIAALQLGDAAALYAIDPAYAPFWCPTCHRSYCSRHWKTETRFDEGFFDDVIGWCPEDHRRLLAD